MNSKLTLIFFFLLTMLNCKFNFIMRGNKFRGKSMFGYENHVGPAWPIICVGTKDGNIPGKVDANGNATYPWNGRENKCENFEYAGGILVFHRHEIPANCKPQGLSNKKHKYYNAIIVTHFGNIPGRADRRGNTAWYSHNKRQRSVRNRFYIIC